MYIYIYMNKASSHRQASKSQNQAPRRSQAHNMFVYVFLCFVSVFSMFRFCVFLCFSMFFYVFYVSFCVFLCFSMFFYVP